MSAIFFPAVRFTCLLLCFFIVLLQPGRGSTADSDETLRYLKSLSLEELLQTEVTSVSKRPESLFEAAAAITVITAEDIRRTGARTIPDILRLAPGVQVGQLDGSKWEVGVRGFNDFFENKLLVLVDGRSVYTPLYAGVYWNMVDTLLADIDRVEIIRGPGATVWGANAVNGVINIITKSSRETQGTLVQALYGTREKPELAVRFGDAVSETTSYRFYAKGFQRDNLDAPEGGEANDRFTALRAGGRLDSDVGENGALMTQAEVYKGEADLKTRLAGFLTPPLFREAEGIEDFQGGFVLAEYHRRLRTGSDITLQSYYERFSHDLFVAEEERDTLDFEFEHRYSRPAGHDIVWGLGVRWTADDTRGSYSTSFSPASRETMLYSVFLQDDITLVDDTLWLTAGTKVEHNDYTGFEVQPSMRLRYKAADNHLLWGAVSRAVRTPSRVERDASIVFASAVSQQGISQFRLQGSDQFDSEELVAYELGYRWRHEEKVVLDLALFYNDYAELRGQRGGKPFFEATPAPAHMVFPELFANNLEGSSYGGELELTWQVGDRLKVIGSYYWINLELNDNEAVLSRELQSEQDYPRHHVKLRSYYDIHPSLSVNGEVYYVDEYRSVDIDDYLRFDLQLIWEALDGLQLAVGGENLFNSGHQEGETIESGIASSEIPTIYWLKATYRF